MYRWLASSLSWIPLLVVLLIGSVGIYAYRAISDSTRAQLTRELTTILEADIQALRIWMDSQRALVRAAAGDPDLVDGAARLLEVARTAHDLRAELASAEEGAALREQVRPLLREHGLDNFTILDPNALVLVDGSQRYDGRVLPAPPSLWDPVMAGEAVFQRSTQNVTGDVETFRRRVATFYSAAPLRAASGEIIAVLVFAQGADDGFSQILQVARMGESGETYAFDEAGVMRSHSRFEDDLIELGLLSNDADASLLEIRDPGGDMVAGFVPPLPVRARPLTWMAAQAVSGLDGSNVDGYRDYRGVEVIGAWRWLPALQLGIATEIDRAEAYAGLDTLRTSFSALGAALGLGSLGLFVYSVVVGRLQRRFDKARRLGRYELMEKIGEGGMGKVYRARHALLRRPTAVKLLEAGSANAEAATRFEREVQAASSLTHPNTIAIFDYGRTPDGVFYYAMEYLDGITLGDLVADEGALPEARVVYIMRQVAASLAEAHAAGMIHRDLKPSNVMLCERGGLRDFVKVLDFGLVREEGTQDDLSLTSVESLTGTPLYLSPEALEAPDKVSPHSDVYQMGAIAYFLLTGGHVFTGDSLVEVLSKHLNTPPVPPSELLGRAVTPELEELVLSCLAKDPAGRPATGAALAEALEKVPLSESWTQEDARHWWADFEARGGRAILASASPPSHPTGLSVDMERSPLRSF